MIVLLLLLLLLGVVQAQEIPQPAVSSPAPDTVYGGGPPHLTPTDLAPGDGRELVASYCSVCHSTTYITMQPPLPGATWEAEVQKMIKVHGAAIPDSAATRIVAYLQAHYTPESIGRKPVPTAPVGEQTYEQTCIACHGDTGKGVVGNFPPLAGRASHIAATAAGRAYLIHVALFGLSGRIEADGKVFDGTMPPWGGMLDNRSMADVLTYVTHTWGAKETVAPFTPEEVAAARRNPLASSAVRQERERLHIR